LRKKRILVIDDDESVAKFFRDALELEGYNVDTAKTGKEAIEKSNMTFYNLALIDIRLPDIRDETSNCLRQAFLAEAMRLADCIWLADFSGSNPFF
jgi:DNA-binding response OmpR family regulator